jgi:hypothetical protein
VILYFKEVDAPAKKELGFSENRSFRQEPRNLIFVVKSAALLVLEIPFRNIGRAGITLLNKLSLSIPVKHTFASGRAFTALMPRPAMLDTNYRL